MAAPRVIIAEDDDAVRDLLAHHFRREGFGCEEAADGPAALRHARSGAQLMLLDLSLPVIDGFDVLRTLRREQRPIGIIVVTARAEEVDRIVGLEMGADDYVTKPFSPREVVARARAVSRRAGIPPPHEPEIVRFGPLEIDEAAREARLRGADLALKPREFALLFELARNAGVALSRAVLLERVWGYDFEGDERTVDVHVRRLRIKLHGRPDLPDVIRTVQRCGYKFVAP